MSNQTKLYAAVAALGIVLLAVVTGVVAFQLGRTSVVRSTEGSPADAEAARPPAIVTNTPTPTLTATPQPSPSPTATPSPTPSPTPIVVINHIDELGRLETAEYSMQTVINLENEPSNIWERVLGTDKLMLVAEGEVVAGIDLSHVTEDDIIVEGTSVEVVLPAPELLYSRIDNERTQVYERQTGLFMTPDPSLESRARQLAEEALVEWAIEKDIFETAAENGRKQIEALLKSLGFTEISVIVEDKDL